MKDRKPGILTFAFLTLLASCAVLSASTETFEPVAGLGKGRLSPRPTPAQVTQESEAALKKKGFVAIGQISRRVVTKTYWNSSDLNVPIPPARRDLTKELCQDAAAQGGDLITLTGDNKPGKRSTSKRGKAIAWSTVRTLQSTYTGHKPGDYTAGYYRESWVDVKVPTAWEEIPGVECYVMSSGTVWRNDPDLPRRLAEWIKEAEEQAKKERMAARQEKKRSFLYGGFHYPARGVFAEGLKPFMNADELYGYIGQDGTVALEPQYGWAGNFSDGLATVVTGDKRMYIDKTGTPVLVLQIECKEWKDFSEGRARVGFGPGYTGEKWGYIDRTGQLVIPAHFDEAGDFSEGLARVKVKGDPDKWGYIDKQGNYVIPPQFYSAGDFREGLAPVWMLLHPGIKQGYIDPLGKWIISDSKFINVREFSEGLAPVLVNIGTEKRGNFKWGYIDKEGKWVIPAQFNDVFPFSDGMAQVEVVKGFNKRKYGFIDRTGKTVVEPVYDRVNDFREGFALAWPVYRFNLEDFSVKTAPAKIITRTGEAVGELDVLGTVRWNPQPQGNR